MQFAGDILPERILVTSMSDLFHESIPDDYVRQVFDVVVRADWHVFQVLTKRAPRLARLGRSLPWRPHLWAGVSIESNQYTFRADHLRKVPAPIRFISAEPLLGPLPSLDLGGIDWLIVGGESGTDRRPIEESWVLALRDAADRAGVAFFFKQWGGRVAKSGGRLLEGRTYDGFPESWGNRNLVPSG